MPFVQRVSGYLERVNAALERWLPGPDIPPAPLHQAMRYAVMAGGKRFRPLLIYATGEVLGIEPARLDGPAAAVEMIHAYSLVHDDLPAMDNDDLRRGQPTCHKAYGEATAILAGDALQVLAFEVLTRDRDMAVGAQARLRMIELLARASGSRGMAGGQALDLAAAGTRPDIQSLERIHAAKTGALIRASVLLAAGAARELEPEQRERLAHYGRCVGLAFQIHDDILDVAGNTEVLGKPRGSDSQRDQPTYVTVLGLDGARARARELHGEACAALESFGEAAEPLRWLSEQVVTRDR